MTRRVEPIWALAFGYLVAPLICLFNGLIFGAIFRKVSWRSDTVVELYASITISTMVLGLVTTRLIRIWNDGSHGQARWWSLGCGTICAAFWIWYGQAWIWNHSFQPSLVGALLLPFLWSIGFFVFAFFARPPKN